MGAPEKLGARSSPSIWPGTTAASSIASRLTRAARSMVVTLPMSRRGGVSAMPMIAGPPFRMVPPSASEHALVGPGILAAVLHHVRLDRAQRLQSGERAAVAGVGGPGRQEHRHLLRAPER